MSTCQEARKILSYQDKRLKINNLYDKGTHDRKRLNVFMLECFTVFYYTIIIAVITVRQSTLVASLILEHSFAFPSSGLTIGTRSRGAVVDLLLTVKAGIAGGTLAVVAPIWVVGAAAPVEAGPIGTRHGTQLTVLPVVAGRAGTAVRVLHVLGRDTEEDMLPHGSFSEI